MQAEFANLGLAVWFSSDLQAASGKFQFLLKQSPLSKLTPILKSWPQGRWRWSKEALKVRGFLQPKEVSRGKVAGLGGPNETWQGEARGRAPTSLFSGTPARSPALPGPFSLTEVAADYCDGDLVHEHRPEAHVLLGAALPEGAQDLHLRVVLTDAPVRQEPELGAHGGQDGGARRGPPGLPGPLALAGGRARAAAPLPPVRQAPLQPWPSESAGHWTPPPTPDSQSARGGGRGPAARPAAEAASAGGAGEGRRGRGPAAVGGGDPGRTWGPGNPGATGARLRGWGKASLPWTPRWAWRAGRGGAAGAGGAGAAAGGVEGCPGWPASGAQQAAGCVPKAVASIGAGVNGGPLHSLGRASGTSQGGLRSLAKVTWLGPS